MKDDQWPPEGSPSAHEASTPEDAESLGTEGQNTESQDARTNGTGPTDGQQFDDAASGSFKPAAGTAVPPPPVLLPGPDATTAGFTGESPAASTTAGAAPGAPADEPPHVRNPLDSNQLAESPAAGSRLADDPLAGKPPADDPLGSDPLTLDRRNASRPPSERSAR